MTDKARKNNDFFKTALDQFLKDIHFQDNTNTQGFARHVVEQVFYRSGHGPLLWLVQLRQRWSLLEDHFFARHAYPRNLALKKSLLVNDELIKQVTEKTLLATNVVTALKCIKGTEFTSYFEFYRQLQRHAHGAVPERDNLSKYLPMNKSVWVLHLTVYDGNFAHMIRSHSSMYLDQLRKLLPDLAVEHLDCQVGSLDKMREDQYWIGYLTQQWEAIVGKEFVSLCLPAYIEAKTPDSGQFVLHVINHAVKVELKKADFTRTLLGYLQEKFPVQSKYLDRIVLKVPENFQPHARREINLSLGQSAALNSAITPALKKLQENVSAESQFAQEQIQIIQGMIRQSPHLLKKQLQEVKVEQDLFNTAAHNGTSLSQKLHGESDAEQLLRIVEHFKLKSTAKNSLNEGQLEQQKIFNRKTSEAAEPNRLQSYSEEWSEMENLQREQLEMVEGQHQSRRIFQQRLQDLIKLVQQKEAQSLDSASQSLEIKAAQRSDDESKKQYHEKMQAIMQLFVENHQEEDKPDPLRILKLTGLEAKYDRSNKIEQSSNSLENETDVESLALPTSETASPSNIKETVLEMIANMKSRATNTKID